MQDKKSTYKEIEKNIDIKNCRKSVFLATKKTTPWFIKNMTEMFQVIELIYHNKNVPIDYYYYYYYYYYWSVNTAFEKFSS